MLMAHWSAALLLVVVVVVDVAVSDDESVFRLDFSPFATFDLPKRWIYPRNEGVGRKRSAQVQEEEKRDPCYSVVVKLGKFL